FSIACRIFSTVFFPNPFNDATLPSSQAACRELASTIFSSLYNVAKRFPPSPGNFNKGINPLGTSSCNSCNIVDSPVSIYSTIKSFFHLPIAGNVDKSFISARERSSLSIVCAALRYAEIRKGFSPFISKYNAIFSNNWIISFLVTFPIFVFLTWKKTDPEYRLYSKNQSFLFNYKNLLKNSLKNNDSIPFDKKGVLLIIIFATTELSIIVCTFSIGTSAVRYKIINITK